MKLEGKVALVTGGGRGIGRAICEGLGAEGAMIIAADVLPLEQIGETIAAVQASGAEGIAVQADVSRRDDVERIVAQGLAQFGRIDILVNNAGIILRASLLDTTDADWQHVFAVNAGGCFLCTQTVARHMIERGGGGQIVNISSINAITGIGQRACYAATKGAIEAFTRCCALELAPHGIQVNAVAPGVTETEMNSPFFTPQVLQQLQARLPMSRVARPDEIAATVVALASGSMPYMTGQILRVDGGWSACDLDYSKTHSPAHG